ncbi:F-box protein 42 [Musca autumnalis]|uniref:F-box protein 42 n=1 Tax=Musca autumnalis TaxID=221902 RepID=UPI003CF217E2
MDDETTTTTKMKVKDQCQNDKVNLATMQKQSTNDEDDCGSNDRGDDNNVFGDCCESINETGVNEKELADGDDGNFCVTKDEEEYHVNMLPDEMLEFILTYLPPYKDLENCRLVCKRWNGIVKNLIRRSKINLHKGLVDYRLSWQVYSQQTAASIDAKNNGGGGCGVGSPTTPIIAGRFSHSAVRHGNSMYVFGGGSSSDTTFNDLWRFDLSEMRWERPLSMGSYPSPKGSASMVCWREQLILFGGWRYPSLHPPYQQWCLFDELHYYDLATNRWSVALTMTSPPPLAGHSASVHGDIMVIFGGYQIIDGVNSNSNETWCLDLVEHRWWQPTFLGTLRPPARYGQFQLVLDEKHLLVVGGCGGPNSVYSDAWLLDMSRDLWQWKSIPVRNKKYAASHMWCNPACKIDSKLVVLGPTPNMPQDFQLMKQARVPVGGGGHAAPRPGGLGHNNHNPLDRHRPRAMLDGGGAIRIPAVNHNRLENHHRRLAGNIPRDGPDDHYFAQRRAILNQHQQNANNNNFVNNHNNIHNVQPRYGSLRDLHQAPSPEERNQNRPSTSAGSLPRLNGSPQQQDNEVVNGGLDQEAANRLQRNLALRCRENEPLLPKRFDELYEDQFRMAAFNVQNRPRSLSKDHNERIRRMEEKMNALRNSRRSAMVEQKIIKEPSPKRAKRNVLSLFVCDLTNALAETSEPYIEWLEYKNYGVIPGAPERLILSTMVPGHGELILFGGVHKETLSEITHQVSNTVHFLSAPRDIV